MKKGSNRWNGTALPSHNHDSPDKGAALAEEVVSLLGAAGDLQVLLQLDLVVHEFCRMALAEKRNRLERMVTATCRAYGVFVCL